MKVKVGTPEQVFEKKDSEKSKAETGNQVGGGTKMETGSKSVTAVPVCLFPKHNVLSAMLVLVVSN